MGLRVDGRHALMNFWFAEKSPLWVVAEGEQIVSVRDGVWYSVEEGDC